MKRLYQTVLFALFTLPLGLSAQTVLPAEPPEQGLTQTLVMVGIMGAFFYLILWRPEQKRRKELESQRESMKKGDRVVAMGIVGTVSKIQDDTIILKMVDGAKIEVLKGAVSEVHADPSTSQGEEG